MVGNVREGDWHQTHGLLTELLVQSMERGTDATGFAAVTSPLDHPHWHRVVTAKAPLAAHEFTATNPFWRALRRMRCCSVIAHVRAATSGTPSVNANNHPFAGRVRDGAFSLVHNGIISDPKLAAARLSVRLATDCDSEVIEKTVSAAGEIPLGLHRSLSTLRGSMAVAAVEHRTGTVWLARDAHRPLWLARLRDGRRSIFASTPHILARAVEARLGRFDAWVTELQPLAAGYVFRLATDGRLFTAFASAARLEAPSDAG